jgi:hypothetical protein
MHTTTAKTGAAAVSRVAQRNPMEVLTSLVEGDPTAGADRLFRSWLDIVREDEDLFIPALRHTFTNMLSCLDRDKRRGTVRAVPVAAQRQLVEQVKERVVQVILMNLTLPSGKLLRDSTFKECASAGGFFARISKQGKPNQVVGKTLTEDHLRRAWNGASK